MAVLASAILLTVLFRSKELIKNLATREGTFVPGSSLDHVPDPVRMEAFQRERKIGAVGLGLLLLGFLLQIIGRVLS